MALHELTNFTWKACIIRSHWQELKGVHSGIRWLQYLCLSLFFLLHNAASQFLLDSLPPKQKETSSNVLFNLKPRDDMLFTLNHQTSMDLTPPCNTPLLLSFCYGHTNASKLPEWWETSRSYCLLKDILIFLDLECKDSKMVRAL